MSRKSKQQPEESVGWKGAFADFCMSMMTLFMVLWIVAIADQEQRESLSLYFNDPGVFDTVNSRYVIKQVTNGFVVSLESSSGKTIVDRPDPIANETRGGDPYELQLMQLSDNHGNVNVKKFRVAC
ncbi:flagellar motor protein MotB [Parendozoicomonas sp. Alg238-R29]|uniref:flagellar motor protein MotB n=1 Tax=Parendozoicomonas sp. Alg238-R29 TaxID=2993446 RepID=UPI00248E5413|nr:flagellar motor protein MotB [Parendozoicomonas sp. Alg238-R29]